ncbi:hypothetical protein BASA82_000368 [Batrachochytrium salamandrivorans]|uniref:RING-type E3 ubiquitin transferase n=1 Tax=Batrachochytrium salamandrivorans TaxID=1357716 RepID=A0ABQ8EZD7_9FUNG|nr:hypothetical protein BASA62_006901 [Batrachochytrium salamandrivorans]KAH6577037.1 hypothetical protein BASA60_004273 [Batrachochytrium salamandrivorans]KAH6580322.1 hypothetical protein BASA61_009695 [Batrachochytrium salamandrivorans]KAH6589285.1 hypothetical protein BASA50_010160 [Batrachochytrium salamandrivorans]KAH9258804.1 hypothetical protein BASA81_002868 [Batrachochytrium salamandrivorans]
MGRNTDKLYISQTEWKTEFGGAKRASGSGSEFKRLPFYCCALSLQPFENPMCTQDGTIFDLLNIVPWIKKQGTNPVTGQPLESKSLFKLHFHKNNQGEYQCPVTYKTFNNHTHIVAIKVTGNVYAYDAVDQLNIKAKNWTDLISGEKFTRKDIITLQDPHKISERNITDFHYLKNDITVVDEVAEKAKAQISYKINAVGSTSRIINEMAAKEKKRKEESAASSLAASATKPPITPSFVTANKKSYNEASFSRGLASSSFTSMAFTPVSNNESAVWTDDEVTISRVKQRGAATMITTYGDLQIELYCPDAPRACFNFIRHAKTGYYKDTLFHRSIPKFMIQGGDPTGTGKGGESVWKSSFPDECKPNLVHSERGILSMANRGKNTNTSQFFFTFGACKHLDTKHTIFGKIVNGLDVLDKLEAVPTNADNRPMDDIKILDIVVSEDPYEAILNDITGKHAKKAEETAQRAADRARKERLISAASGVSLSSDRVGKYLDKVVGKRKADEKSEEAELDTIPVAPKRQFKSGGFSNFDGW